ncbi:uncharacterized protein LOC128234542 [Mya arenaria]|uniref:uncharacterized protein LOC128234542 n=1 Tax=Mya arenaria TaxID=6604 RepID=UPI0022E44127|nr:uncharacterized protein LOC128234542 [Mya arenaria]
MLEALNNSVHFQCVVTIPTIDWKTPEKYRGNFYFVWGNDNNQTSAFNTTTSVDPSVEKDSDSTSSTLLIAGAVGGTFVAVVTCLVVLIWLKRKYNGGCNCLQNAVELRQSAKNKGDNDITEPDNQAYDQYENLSDAGRSHYSHLDAAQLASHASKCNDLTMYMDK